MLEITFIQKGHKLNSKSKSYINEKITKHQELLSKATGISVLTRYNENYAPDRRYRMEISLSMPHTFIKVEERGVSLESLIDQLEVLLRRKVKRYLGQFNKWEKQEPWKVVEARELANNYDEDDYDYSDYQPVVKQSKLDSTRPIHIGEAIERLEMSGRNAILFKNYSTDKYAMLYRDDQDEYELIEEDV